MLFEHPKIYWAIDMHLISCYPFVSNHVLYNRPCILSDFSLSKGHCLFKEVL